MRKPNWPSILAEQIRLHQNVEFSWGGKDCCLAVADIVFEFTGKDYAEKFRGYTTELGSKKALITHANGDISSAISEIFEPVNVAVIGRGDLAIVDTDSGVALGIQFSNMIWVMSPSGMVSLPKNKAIKAWRVD